eukprot:g2475.t1
MACSATLKWQKQRFVLQLTPGSAALELKQQVCELTGVPVARQKLMCKGAWKGALKDDMTLSPVLKQGQRGLTVLLIGSAETIVAPRNASAGRDVVRFQEDLSPAQLEAERAAAVASALQDAEGMIPALQEPPGIGRDDGKAESFQYNHFVFGWPQKRIEATMARRRQQAQLRDEDVDGAVTGGTSEHGNALLGVCAMQLGTELGKEFVTALAVMEDGTLLSGTDSGHIHMWLHAIRILEVVHEPAPMSGTGPGPIEALVCLNAPESDPSFTNTGAGVGAGTSTAHTAPAGEASPMVSFVSAANGTVKLWNTDAECLRTISGMPGMTPRTLVAVYPHRIAVAWRQAHTFDPNAFRLPPQDAAQRRRREESERRQAEQQRAFDDAASTVTVIDLVSHPRVTHYGPQTSELLAPPTRITPSAPPTPPAGANMHPAPDASNGAPAVMGVVALGTRGEGDLVCGDATAALAIWTKDLLRAGSWVAAGSIQLRLQNEARGGTEPTEPRGLSVVCMTALPSHGSNVLAVSITTSGVANPLRHTDGVIMLDVPYVSTPVIRRMRDATAAEDTCAQRVGGSCSGISDECDSIGGCISTETQVAMHAVLILRIDRRQPSILAVLAGHCDIVQCVCELPGRALATAGAKHDAMVKVWHAKQWEDAPQHEQSAAHCRGACEHECSQSQTVVLRQAAEALDEPGHVFAMVVLPDQKPGSQLFALAGAWYNRVKICL